MVVLCNYGLHSLGNKVHRELYPELFSYAINKNITIQQTKNLGFCGPLPLAAIWWSECTFSGSRQWAAKYPTVGWKRRMEIQLEVLELLFSKRHTNWSTSIPQPHPLDIRLPMENKVLTKTKTLFFWLLLHDKLLRRHMELESCTCENCTRQRIETWSHLFFRCSFARRCWQIVDVTSPRTCNPHWAVQKMMSDLHKPWSMELIITMLWCI